MSRTRKRVITWALAAALVLTGAARSAPGLVRGWWAWHASNPVRRGVARAEQLGCFGCHGWQGAAGIADPGEYSRGVPAWSGDDWTIYVMDTRDVRDFILDGHTGDASSPDADQELAGTIRMPAYRDVLSGTDLEDLVAAFTVLSGMRRPVAGSAARRGLDLAVTWDCLACHGAAGSGGLPNPGSFTGFIPGWYGPDFSDLVRSRDEFETWIRQGSIPRLSGQAVARYFLARQRISMPPYPRFTSEQIDDLWSYAAWLDRTGGGVKAERSAKP
ncbi:MAG: c-type cytochrome [Acidobacteriota bacterium]